MLKPLSLLVAALLTAACSSTSQDLASTLNYAVRGSADIEVSAQKVSDLPYASSYLRVGDNPQAFVVLAYADTMAKAPQQLSWLAADKNAFITQGGRLIQTHGLANDLSTWQVQGQDYLPQGGQWAEKLAHDPATVTPKAQFVAQ
ncbi:MAG: YjbF family lipoprotein, partial [Aeromonas sp.]